MTSGPVLCPYCNGICDAEFVDIGVGYQQVTAYQCRECQALQMGHPKEDLSKATAEERKNGWWRGPPWMYEKPNPYAKEPEDVERIKKGLLSSGKTMEVWADIEKARIARMRRGIGG